MLCCSQGSMRLAVHGAVEAEGGREAGGRWSCFPWTQQAVCWRLVGRGGRHARGRPRQRATARDRLAVAGGAAHLQQRVAAPALHTQLGAGQGGLQAGALLAAGQQKILVAHLHSSSRAAQRASSAQRGGRGHGRGGRPRRAQKKGWARAGGGAGPPRHLPAGSIAAGWWAAAGPHKRCPGAAAPASRPGCLQAGGAGPHERACNVCSEATGVGPMARREPRRWQHMQAGPGPAQEGAAREQGQGAGRRTRRQDLGQHRQLLQQVGRRVHQRRRLLPHAGAGAAGADGREAQGEEGGRCHRQRTHRQPLRGVLRSRPCQSAPSSPHTPFPSSPLPAHTWHPAPPAEG